MQRLTGSLAPAGMFSFTGLSPPQVRAYAAAACVCASSLPRQADVPSSPGVACVNGDKACLSFALFEASLQYSLAYLTGVRVVRGPDCAGRVR